MSKTQQSPKDPMQAVYIDVAALLGMSPDQIRQLHKFVQAKATTEREARRSGRTPFPETVSPEAALVAVLTFCIHQPLKVCPFTIGNIYYLMDEALVSDEVRSNVQKKVGPDPHRPPAFKGERGNQHRSSFVSGSYRATHI